MIDGGEGSDKLLKNGQNVSMSGSAGNDRLLNCARQATITGGKGNDTVATDDGYGTLLFQYALGDGNDTFIYKAGEGKDTIFDYSSGDMLKILKSNGKTGSFSKSKFIQQRDAYTHD